MKSEVEKLHVDKQAPVDNDMILISMHKIVVVFIYFQLISFRNAAVQLNITIG